LVAADLAVDVIEEGVEERLLVLRPLAERRQVKGNDLDAIEQVLAEAPGGDELVEVPIGRANHPHVELA